ncbi:cholinesterase-like [Apostichopus japonicus]|uniref:cholinesterase-like n=1 Tax=Stichopus japonicus TaxID=307972 RepID=UPI003AB36B9E
MSINYCLSIFLVICSFSLVNSKPYVTITQGRLFGETVDFVDNEVSNIVTKVDVFKGIPFAEPPIRFSPPLSKSGWEGDWNATYFRPACIQGPDGFKFWFKPEMDEDCLYLNVFAPHPKPKNAPVMVYMHGGSYSVGSAIEEAYSGIPLAAIGDVIIVTTNYRLGVFGFFSTGDSASPGNYGLLDQAEALKWVHQNIEEFGGDKNSVTIFGESAGARAVHLHMFSKISAPYFHRAIMQSGVAEVRYDPAGEQKDALYVGSRFGCDTSDTHLMIDCLRDIEAMDLLYNSPYRIVPNVDGYFLEDSPENLILKGEFKHCPIIVGFNEDEGTLTASLYIENSETAKDPPHVQKEKFDEMVLSLLQGTGKFVNGLIEDSVKQEYVDWSHADNDSADYLDTFVRIRSDQRYSCGAIEVSKAHARLQIPAYLYKMTQIPSNSVFEYYGVGPGWFRAGHVEDVQYVYGTGFITELLESQPATLEDKQLSVEVMTFWTNFATSGDPSRKNLSDTIGDEKWEWPKYELSGQGYKVLGPGLPIGRAPRSDECQLWTSVIPDLQMLMMSMEDVEREWREEFSDWKDNLDDWRNGFRLSQDNTC